MADKAVLFVGLSAEQMQSIPLPAEIEAVTVATSDEAVDYISLSPPELVVANDRIGNLDSLELFGKIVDADPGSCMPVIFLAQPDSGVLPFLYQRRRMGFEARYLDHEGNLHTAFIEEPATERAFKTKPIQLDNLGDEIGALLSDDLSAAPSDDNWQEQIWQIGFNQDIAFKESEFHIQTEVSEIDPVVVSTTVFNSGQALHFEEHKLKGATPSLDSIRHRIEAIHATVVGRLQAGEIEL